MGHAVEFFEFPYKTNPKKIFAEISDWGAHNADYEETGGHYHGNFKLLPDKIFKTYEEAEKYLECLDSYVDRGVVFYKYPTISPTAAIKKIENQIQKLMKTATDFGDSHTIQSQKSEFIGCKHCNSKINKKYLRPYSASRPIGKETEIRICENKVKYFTYYQVCPVCGKDLRADYIIEKLKEYCKKIDDLLNKRQNIITAVNTKNFKKAEKWWLCKAEVHC